MNYQTLLKNKVIFYLTSRYITYFIQFLSSIVIAVKLGPYYMGVWGFLLLLTTYFQQCHFGIANSLNVLMVHSKDDKNKVDNYIANSLILVCYQSIIVTFIYIYYLVFGFSIFNKFHVTDYFVWVCIIAILQYFSSLIMNIFRVRNMLNFVAFCQSIVVLLNFICLFFFTGKLLISFLIGGYVLGNFICILLFIFSNTTPVFSSVKIRLRIQQEIIRKGLYLFLYNSCFYFIVISIRSIISSYYSVSEFGLFTFAYLLLFSQN